MGLRVSIPFRADTGFELNAPAEGWTKEEMFQSLSGLTLGLNAESSSSPAPYTPFQSLSGLTLGLNRVVWANPDKVMTSFNPFQG